MSASRARLVGHPSRAALAGIAAASALTGAHAADGPPPSAPRVVVEVGTVSVRPVTVNSWIPGSIVSRADARIASVIGGRVMWIAEVGTRVREGDPIARLDDTMPRLRAE
ncbi:MAG: hypothetical protein E6K46_10340, partial [Gammaproteobacteria bacterium]